MSYDQTAKKIDKQTNREFPEIPPEVGFLVPAVPQVFQSKF